MAASSTATGRWLASAHNGADLVFVATADSPEDTANQWVHVLDGSGLTERAAGECVLQQSMRIDPAVCVTPHEMGVDAANGDVYLGCVTQNATQGSVRGLIRLRQGTV